MIDSMDSGRRHQGDPSAPLVTVVLREFLHFSVPWFLRREHAQKMVLWSKGLCTLKFACGHLVPRVMVLGSDWVMRQNPRESYRMPY